LEKYPKEQERIVFTEKFNGTNKGRAKTKRRAAQAIVPGRGVAARRRRAGRGWGGGAGFKVKKLSIIKTKKGPREKKREIAQVTQGENRVGLDRGSGLADVKRVEGFGQTRKGAEGGRKEVAREISSHATGEDVVVRDCGGGNQEREIGPLYPGSQHCTDKRYRNRGQTV